MCCQTITHLMQMGESRETLRWSHQYLSSDDMGPVGSDRFPSCDSEALGAFLHSMGSQGSTLLGKKEWTG